MPHRKLTDEDVEKIRERLDDAMMAVPHLAHHVRLNPLSRKHRGNALAKARRRKKA